MNTKLFKVALAALLLTLAACGKKDANEARVSQGPGNTVEIKDKDGKIAMVASAQGVALPEDFPKDMPVMKDAVVKMSIDAGSNRIVMLSVANPVAEVLAFYQENLKTQGWKIDATTSTPESAILNASKAGGRAQVTIAKDGKETSIQMTVPKGKS
jgi:predicted small lipoprotein YifL